MRWLKCSHALLEGGLKKGGFGGWEALAKRWDGSSTAFFAVASYAARRRRRGCERARTAARPARSRRSSENPHRSQRSTGNSGTQVTLPGASPVFSLRVRHRDAHVDAAKHGRRAACRGCGAPVRSRRVDVAAPARSDSIIADRQADLSFAHEINEVRRLRDPSLVLVLVIVVERKDRARFRALAHHARPFSARLPTASTRSLRSASAYEHRAALH